jgi:hypothetical protein
MNVHRDRLARDEHEHEGESDPDRETGVPHTMEDASGEAGVANVLAGGALPA